MFGFIKDTFFGGAEKDAAEAQQKSLERSQEFIEEGVKQGKEDINRLFPQAQSLGVEGFQGALDAFGQFMPQQASMMQQGNVGAQQALLSGLPQMNNAILGQPIDYSGMQAQTLDYDPSMFQQQMPSGFAALLQQAGQQGQSGGNQTQPENPTYPPGLGRSFNPFQYNLKMR